MTSYPRWWGKPTTAPPPTSFDQSASDSGKRARAGPAAMMVAVAITTAIAGVMFGFILPLNLAARSTVASVEHTREVIEAVDGVVASAGDLETGQRGFLLTRDAAYLEPYDQGKQLIWHRLSHVQSLTADNPRQADNLTNLTDLLRKKTVELAGTIELARHGDINGAIDIVRRGEGKSLMDDIRQVTGDILSEEQRLLLQRRTEARQSEQRSTQVVLTLCVLLVVGLLLITVLITRAVNAGANRRRLATEAVVHQRLVDMVNIATVMMREVDGIIHFWSEGCRRLFGYTAEQAIGRLSHELLQTVFPVSLADLNATLLRDGTWSGELRHHTLGRRRGDRFSQ